MERHVGGFEIQVDLPCSVLPSSGSAHLHNGVLHLSIHKVSDQRARTYTISVREDDADHE
jgi:HSP20 family molecular chaperone IbpA